MINFLETFFRFSFFIEFVFVLLMQQKVTMVLDLFLFKNDNLVIRTECLNPDERKIDQRIALGYCLKMRP